MKTKMTKKKAILTMITNNITNIIKSITATTLSIALTLTLTPIASANTDLSAYRVKISNYGGMYGNAPFSKAALPSYLINNGYLYQRKLPTSSTRNSNAVDAIDMIKLEQSAIAILDELYQASIPQFEDFGMLPIWDQQVTEIEISTPLGSTKTAVYLPYNDVTTMNYNLTPTQVSNRERLRKALYALDDLKGRKLRYKPTFYEYHTVPWGEVKEKDKKLAVRLKTTPAPSKHDYCFTISAANLPRSLKYSNTYQLPNKKYQYALLRPILPGEYACERTQLI